ncbi:uncharacterized protein EI97DRAFT_482330 [Westerdykella ornata]|uniref:Uncharacterized protein n=1 Tax=Westerdykella ornata TaxID=318751 RepID=A0A6A6JSR5_WESOR|nr:uncharacterized protein EI97DRAFT_482330 [Westerdykella ornata]KAF2279651.1 hypothetical protein EI97DRAFT_482330 [Westerdykella ornata]
MPVYILPFGHDPRRARFVSPSRYNATSSPPALNSREFPGYPHSASSLRLDAEAERRRCENTALRVPKCLPALCLASRRLFNEATPVFLRNTTWVIRSGPANLFLTQFLETIPDDKGFKAVKGLRFTSFHWFRGLEVYGRNLDLMLMRRCTGLRHVEFTFHMERLAKPAPDGSETEYRLKSIDEIVAFYGLEDIFKCEELKTLTIDAIDYWVHEHRCDGSPRQRLQDLVDWIVDGFLERHGKKVTATIEWRTYRYRVDGWTPYDYL